MRRLAACLVVPLVCSGCFIFEEIEAGQEIMEKHTPKETRERREREAAEARAQREQEDARPGPLARVEAWWAGYQREREREARSEQDANDPIVACSTGGQTHFTRKSDCQARGGAFAER